ncbi:MAG: tetratricopeptide repeat protein [Acidobacteria bacterium]|nr:tetratricopeptide repeat protein [Acidobacteriota bacterium]MCW5948160.1 tetratricopeptide repeat protein [Pyrinomonadaceae bacterium]
MQNRYPGLSLSIVISTLLIVTLPGVYGQAKPSVRPAPAPAMRSITVVSEPSAVVWIDGVRYGRTSREGKLTISTISPGPHTVTVRADGFKQVSQPLTTATKGEIRITLVKTNDIAELAFQEGERLMSSDRDKAIEAYGRAIASRPAYPEAHVALARAQIENGDLDEAAQSIASARRYRPGYAEASAVEGRLFKEKGEEAKAIASFKRALSEGKTFQPEALTGLGLLYKERGEGFGASGDYESEKKSYTEAARYLRTGIKQLSGAPDAMVLYQILGLLYERMENFRDAISTYEEFLRVFPDSAEATAVRSFIVQLRKQMSGE